MSNERWFPSRIQQAQLNQHATRVWFLNYLEFAAPTEALLNTELLSDNIEKEEVKN